MEKICKIVYFDEKSVADYVQIAAGGEPEKPLSYSIQERHRKGNLGRLTVR